MHPAQRVVVQGSFQANWWEGLDRLYITRVGPVGRSADWLKLTLWNATKHFRWPLKVSPRSTCIYPAPITDHTLAEYRTYIQTFHSWFCGYPGSIVKKLLVISGGKLCLNHAVHKEKRRILRALGVVFYLGTGTQKSVQVCSRQT